MKQCFWMGIGLAVAMNSVAAEHLAFADKFAGQLQPGWRWTREDAAAWRIDDQALHIRVLPGNMWGGANNARNVLVREIPLNGTNSVQISVHMENRPTEQYEQVDLVWYYDDSHMVKIGQELVDKKLSVVMGREEKDKTRTIAIVPLESFVLTVRFTATGNRLRGEFNIPGETNWRLAGECDLPSNDTPPKASIQCYQGSKQVEHWAKLTNFKIVHFRP